MGWSVVVGAACGLVALWLTLVATLCWMRRKQGEPARLKDVLRVVPDVVRLFGRLAADPMLPRGVRVKMVLLTAYLLMPVDLVPDFIPVVGYADDALIIVWGLRSISRSAGADALDRHWPGSPEGLVALKSIAGV